MLGQTVSAKAWTLPDKAAVKWILQHQVFLERAESGEAQGEESSMEEAEQRRSSVKSEDEEGFVAGSSSESHT